MAARATNTLGEWCQGFLKSSLGDIAQAMTLPDVDDNDLSFLMDLQAQIQGTVVQKMREPVDAMQQQGLTAAVPGGAPGPMNAPPGAGMPMMPPGAGPGGPPGMPPDMGGGAGGMPPGAPIGPPPPGMMQGPGAGMPNPDELRRLLSGVT